MRHDMSGKVAIIIGGTQGMGAGTAELLASRGAQVMISSRTAGDCRAMADSLNARFGDGGIIAGAHAGDLQHKADLQAIVDATLAQFGSITTLVLAPTIRPYFGRSSEMPDDEIDAQFLYIFKSRFWISNLCVPAMVQAGGGSVVFIGSGSAFEATAERNVYACARAAEVQLMRNFAAEHGRDNVRFNLISPGLIDSSGAQALFQDADVLRSFTDRLPMQRHGHVWEIAEAAAFLASDASAFTTGAVIPVDGGRNLHATASMLTSAFAAEKDDRHRG